MKPTQLPVFIDEAFVPTIEALTEYHGVGCARAYLSMLMTSALLEADQAAREETLARANMRDEEPPYEIEYHFDLGDDDDDDHGGGNLSTH